MHNDQSALAGLRVVDLATSVAGMAAAMLLADLGADVIRFGSSSPRLPGEVMWQRNKRIVPPSPEAVASAVATCDVVVTSDVAGPDALQVPAGVDSTVVHLDMSMLLPEAGAEPVVYEAMLNAWYGIAARQSSYEGGPIDLVVPFASYAQALGGVTATLAALVERQKSGLGQRVVVDARHGVLTAATTTSMIDLDAPAPKTAVGPSGPTPNYAPYRCADGQWIFLAALSPKFQRAAFAVLGIPGLLDDPRIAQDGSRFWHPDNQGWVRDMIASAFLAGTREEWLQRMRLADVPCGPLGDPTTWLDHPQLRAIGQRIELADPLVGPAVTAGFPVVFDGTPVEVFEPRVFAESAQWLSEPWTFAAPAGSATLPSVDGPLAGIRILDLGTVVAGPFTGRLLAGLGADVIKVEPLAGDAFRPTGPQYTRGHRSIAINLANVEGRATFLRLVELADVVLDNFRPGVLEKLGIDHAALQLANPSVITASISGFGVIGPIGGDPGFDPVLQAMSGMMSVQGGSGEPVFNTVAANDLSAGMALAMGICTALLVHERRGVGQHLSTSLAAVSAYMLSGEVVDYANRPPLQRGGRDFRGPSPLSRFYQTRDGWVRLHLESSADAVRAGLTQAQTTPAEVESVLGAAAADLTADELIHRVRTAGGWAVNSRTTPEVASDPDEITGGYLELVARTDGKEFIFPANYARFSRTPRRSALIMPGVGEHTVELLSETGLSASEVAELRERKVVVADGRAALFAVAAYR